MTVTIRQNIFCQIFEELVSIKISPLQNFVLYGTSVCVFVCVCARVHTFVHVDVLQIVTL